jgi:hypothetical protein
MQHVTYVNAITKAPPCPSLAPGPAAPARVAHSGPPAPERFIVGLAAPARHCLCRPGRAGALRKSPEDPWIFL